MGNISIDNIKKLPKELVVQPIYFDEEEKQKTISEAYSLAKQLLLYTLDKDNKIIPVRFSILLRLLGISNLTFDQIGTINHCSKQNAETVQQKFLKYIEEVTSDN